MKLTVSTSGGAQQARLVQAKRLLRLKCSFLFAATDLIAMTAAFSGANLIYWQDPGFESGMAVLLALAPVYLSIALLHRVFDFELIRQPWGGSVKALQALVQATAAVLFIAYFLKAGDEFSRGVFIIGAVLALILMPVSRLVLTRGLARLLGSDAYCVVVIRDDVPYAPGGSELVVTPDQLGFDPTTSDPFQFHALSQSMAGVDRVLVACSQERYQLWSTVLKSMTLSGEILTAQHDHIGIIGVGHFGSNSTMIVAAGRLHLGERLVKRGFDLTVATVGVLLLSPLLIVVAVAISLESRGTVLFKQDRIGRDNRIFRVFKFRSMYTEACDARASQLTARNDPRVTRVGDFIRRTSIDELPQLINVLRGEMSIVGPRPHPLGAKAADLLYWDVDPRYRHRHAIKPGLTGLAQVRGFRGNTERVEDLTNRLQADLEYALDWSLWRDLQIIGRTLLVLRHDNAF